MIPREFPSNLQYEVTQCTVSDNNGASFNIVEDSCPNPVVSGNIFTSDMVAGPFTSEDDKNFGMNRFGMEYRAFVFNSENDEHEMNLSCDVTVCTIGHCPQLCN